MNLKVSRKKTFHRFRNKVLSDSPVSKEKRVSAAASTSPRGTTGRIPSSSSSSSSSSTKVVSFSSVGHDDDNNNNNGVVPDADTEQQHMECIRSFLQSTTIPISSWSSAKDGFHAEINDRVRITVEVRYRAVWSRICGPTETHGALLCDLQEGANEWGATVVGFPDGAVALRYELPLTSLDDETALEASIRYYLDRRQALFQRAMRMPKNESYRLLYTTLG